MTDGRPLGGNPGHGDPDPRASRVGVVQGYVDGGALLPGVEAASFTRAPGEGVWEAREVWGSAVTAGAARVADAAVAAGAAVTAAAAVAATGRVSPRSTPEVPRRAVFRLVFIMLMSFTDGVRRAHPANWPVGRAVSRTGAARA